MINQPNNSLELLSIDLSNYCSKECSFCYNHSHREGNTMWKPQEVISFATDCIAHGVKAVSLGGGEPFEFDGVFDVISDLQKKCHLSVTSNGLPLEDESVWIRLLSAKPDKIHVTIHRPHDEDEVQRVLRRMNMLQAIGIKPGINLLVGADNIQAAKVAYMGAIQILSADQIILVPQRFSNTPSPKQLASVSGGHPFQSPSCLLGCKRPTNFASVSWDKKVNSCSFAGGKMPLPSLDFSGLQEALSKVTFKSCNNVNPIAAKTVHR